MTAGETLSNIAFQEAGPAAAPLHKRKAGSTDTPASEGSWKVFNTHPNPFGFTYKKRHGIRVCVTTRSSLKNRQPAGTRAGHPLTPHPGTERRCRAAPGRQDPTGARPAGKHRRDARGGPRKAATSPPAPPGPSPALSGCGRRLPAGDAARVTPARRHVMRALA
ncbi:uncharacterized protein ACIBXB_009198 [Morphnus guianensis]